MTINVKYKAVHLLLIASFLLLLGSCKPRGESRFRDVDQLKPERITITMKMT